MLPRDIKWLRKDAEYRRLEAETCNTEWTGTEDEQLTERRKACRARRKQWGQNSCDERGPDRGACAECESDMAFALETSASKQRRLDAHRAMQARATALRSANRVRPTKEGDHVGRG